MEPSAPVEVNATPNTPQEMHDSSRDFRFFLQEELIRRCKKNPRFSLRAFARTLDVEASALSKILNGKRSITKKMLHRMSDHLGLGPDQVESFERSLPKSRFGSRKGLRTDDDFQQVSVDIFNVIADWYHYAILELLTVKGFQTNPAWIARALGISVPTANFAIERLLRLGLLKISDLNVWTAEQMTTTGNNFTAAAFRKLQAQILSQAIEAMDTVPLDQRDQSSMTMAVSLKNLAAAKEKIREFRRELCAFLQQDGPHDEVYQLSVALFPISHVAAMPASHNEEIHA